MCIKWIKEKKKKQNNEENKRKRQKIVQTFWENTFANKEYPKPDEPVMNTVILERWKKIWTGDAYYNENDDYFYPLFVETYDFVKEKADKNKHKNFRWKRGSLLGIGLFFLLILIINCVADVWTHEDTIWLENIRFLGNLVKNGTVRLILRTMVSFARTVGGFYSTSEQFIFLCALLSAFFFGWVNIRKYQETWVRHNRHKHKLDKEMFLFVERLEPYQCDTNRKQIFINNILKIWDGNSVKFEKNMKKEQSSPLDLLKSVTKSE